MNDSGGTTSSGDPQAGGRESDRPETGGRESDRPETGGRESDRPDAGDSGAGPSDPAGAEARASGSRQGGSAWSGPLADIQETVSEIVDTAIRGFGGTTTGRFPRYDLVRLPEEGYRLYLDLSGVDRDEIEVTTVGDELTVSGQRRRPGLPEGAEVLRSERAYGRFRRSIRMPADVDPARVSARLDAGVLVLSLPRRTETASRRVEVES